MTKAMLNELVEITQKYLGHEHPEIEIADAKIAAKLVILYRQVTGEVEEIDAHLIRHRVGTAVGKFDLMLELERLGPYTGFCLHIEQDDTLMASWKEIRKDVH